MLHGGAHNRNLSNSWVGVSECWLFVQLEENNENAAQASVLSDLTAADERHLRAAGLEPSA